MKSTWNEEESWKEGMKYGRKLLDEAATNTKVGARSYRDVGGKVLKHDNDEDLAYTLNDDAKFQ